MHSVVWLHEDEGLRTAEFEDPERALEVVGQVLKRPYEKLLSAGGQLAEW